MAELTVTTTNGADAMLEQTGIETFQSSLRGDAARAMPPTTMRAGFTLG